MIANPSLLLLTFVLLLAGAVQAIYPDELWDNSVLLESSDFEATIRKEIEKGKTLFIRFISSPESSSCLKQAPSWDYVVDAFKGNDDVSFADVNLKDEASKTLSKHKYAGSPGNLGWPTIRYYNKETGMEGGDYIQKTKAKLSDELKKHENIISYIESRAGTTMCDLTDGCDNSEKAFIRQFRDGGETAITRALSYIETKDQEDKIVELVDESMQYELRRWLGQRRTLLNLLRSEKDMEEL
jgi:hypothetical protein